MAIPEEWRKERAKWERRELRRQRREPGPFEALRTAEVRSIKRRTGRRPGRPRKSPIARAVSPYRRFKGRFLKTRKGLRKGAEIWEPWKVPRR